MEGYFYQYFMDFHGQYSFNLLKVKKLQMIEMSKKNGLCEKCCCFCCAKKIIPNNNKEDKYITKPTMTWKEYRASLEKMLTKVIMYYYQSVGYILATTGIQSSLYRLLSYLI